MTDDVGGGVCGGVFGEFDRYMNECSRLMVLFSI